jgi:outer membrane receptor protein involved in Fe transport
VAQETTTGSIEGRVMDAQGLAVPGATVTVTSAQGTKTFTTDAEGRYFAPFLTPGNYTVRVELQGFRPLEQKNVLVRLGQRVDLPLSMQVGGLTETVEVTGTSPTVDTSTTTIGATLANELLTRVPVQRQYTDALYIAPGVSSSGDVGRANPSISGASGLENQYIVDGVNTTNTGYGGVGSYSIVFGSLGSGVPFDFLKEVQVKTGGYSAEYGQATGGVVNVVTKSGSNEYRGTLFGYARPEALEGDWTPVVTTNATRSESVNFTATQEFDGGFEIGGPILRDRAFFFGAADPQWRRNSFQAPEQLPLFSLGSVDRDRRTYAYAAKGTVQLTPSHRLDVSAFGDPSRGDNGPQRRSSLLQVDTASFSEIKYGGNSQNVKYDGVLQRNWLLEASYSRAANNIEETPSVNEWNVRNTLVVPNINTGGIGFYEVGNDGLNHQFQAKSTNIFGGHQIRYGFNYERINYDNVIQRTGPTFVTPDGTQTATGAEITILPDPVYGAIYRVQRANLSNVRSTKQDYFSFFVQDTWRIGDRITLRPGLRYEQQKLIGNISDFQWDNNWAPRIGGTFDPLGNGRMKLFANWGRFFAKVPNDLAARALSADAGITRADFFDAGLTQPVPEGVAAAGQTTHYVTAGLSASDFDPDSKSTYMDETIVGVEYELVQGLNVGVRYVHRRFGRVLEDVGTLPMVAYFLPDVPGADSVEYFITNPTTSTPVVGNLGASFEKAIHDYDSVEFTADKRFGNNWALQASYRWSRLHGNFEGFFRNDNGQSDPAITSLFDFPTNDPSYTAIGVPQFGFRGDIRYLGALGAGPLPIDQPHQVKVYGSYAFNMGLNVGAGFNVASGFPLTALAANPLYESPGEIPETPRGAGFQTVDGFRDRTDWQHSVDAHADYAFRLGGTRRLVVLADIFNLADTQQVIKYDNYTEISPTVLNPDFGVRLEYQAPRQVRLGARFEF